MSYNSRALASAHVRHMALFIVALAQMLNTRIAFAAELTLPQVQAAAKKGNVPREVELAGDYVIGRGVPQDLQLAAHWYQKAAEQGDPEAQNQIGYFYQEGIGVPADSARAVHWYQLSAASGFVDANVNLGVAYLWGSGVPKDQALALQLFHEAVNKRSGIAATYLGDLYYLGIAVSQDRVAAEHWYETGFKLHNPIAAYYLGVFYFDAKDHPHDYHRAAKLLRQAAAAGYVPGVYKLGVLLIKHPEFAKSPQEARTFLETAADSGSWQSSIALGVLARDGDGVPPDPAAAYYHFQIAILQGGDAAKRILANDMLALSSKLPDERKRELVSSADDWFHQRKASLEFVEVESNNGKRFPTADRSIEDDGIRAGQLLPRPPA